MTGTVIRGATSLTLACMLATLLPGVVRAHCDTMDGPVVRDAKTALAQGDVTPVLKWVKPDSEAEVREAFARTMSVRKLGAEAAQLADTWFFETLVRVHRAGEGAPYTGLKPAGAPVEPAVAAADAAIETASPDALVRMVTHAVADGIRERLARVIETREHADGSVEAGREFVEAYVVFVHYVERLHLAAETDPSDHATEGQATPEHTH